MHPRGAIPICIACTRPKVRAPEDGLLMMCTSACPPKPRPLNLPPDSASHEPPTLLLTIDENDHSAACVLSRRLGPRSLVALSRCRSRSFAPPPAAHQPRRAAWAALVRGVRQVRARSGRPRRPSEADPGRAPAPHGTDGAGRQGGARAPPTARRLGRAIGLDGSGMPYAPPPPSPHTSVCALAIWHALGMLPHRHERAP